MFAEMLGDCFNASLIHCFKVQPSDAAKKIASKDRIKAAGLLSLLQCRTLIVLDPP